MKKKIILFQIGIALMAIAWVYISWSNQSFNIYVKTEMDEQEKEWVVKIRLGDEGQNQSSVYTAQQLNSGVNIKVGEQHDVYELTLMPYQKAGFEYNIYQSSSPKKISTGAFQAKFGDSLFFHAPIDFFVYKGVYDVEMAQVFFEVNVFQYIICNNSIIRNQLPVEDPYDSPREVEDDLLILNRSYLNSYELCIRNENRKEVQKAMYFAQIINEGDTIFRYIPKPQMYQGTMNDTITMNLLDPYLQWLMTSPVRYAHKVEIEGDTWLLKNLEGRNSTASIDNTGTNTCPEYWNRPSPKAFKKFLKNLGYFEAIKYPQLWEVTQSNWEYLALKRNESTNYRINNDSMYLAVSPDTIQLLPYTEEVIPIRCHCVY